MYYLRYPGNSSKDWINKFKCICLKALALWTKLGIEKAHVVSHDMGDSVLTEILTRCLHQIDFFKSQLFLDWNVAPCLIGLPTSSRVSSSPTEAWDTTSSTLDLLRWNFHFIATLFYFFFIPDSSEITLGKSFGRFWIKVNVGIWICAILRWNIVGIFQLLSGEIQYWIFLLIQKYSWDIRQGRSKTTGKHLGENLSWQGSSIGWHKGNAGVSWNWIG